MTSDAKIGLLLGLVFIFIIAFIINGMPNFSSAANNNELTSAMLDGKTYGLAANERKVNRQVIYPTGLAFPENLDSANQLAPVRYQIDLPALTPAAQSAIEAAMPQNSSAILPQVDPKPVAIAQTQNTGPNLPTSYVVSSGDTLAVIAKKFYGSEEGNKRASIQAIFEANRDVLKSPDEVYVGQKLTIPRINSSPAQQAPKTGIPASSLLETVKSIGQRHLPTQSQQSAPAPTPAKITEYVVQSGDNLWKIAQSQLGDGNRYAEIAKLNSDILRDQNNIIVGTKIKLPPK